MIPLLPIYVTKNSCNQITITDTTDYSTLSSGAFSFQRFKDGFRLIKITYPDGTYKIYSSKTNINPPASPGNPNPVNLGIEYLDTDITDANNGNAQWTLDIPGDGDYTVQILSMPYTVFGPAPCNLYQSFDMTMQLVDTYYVLFGIYFLPESPQNCIYLTGNLNPDFSVTPFPDQVYSDTWTNSEYINSKTFNIDCELIDALNCIFEEYKNSMCTDCGCDSICKNKKSANIIKASMLLQELSFYEVGSDEYEEKYDTYKEVIKKLCQCK